MGLGLDQTLTRTPPWPGRQWSQPQTERVNGPYWRPARHTWSVMASFIAVRMWEMPKTKKGSVAFSLNLRFWNQCTFFPSHEHYHDTLPLPPHSHILPHLPGTHSHTSGLHTASWCRAYWRDTSRRLTADICPAPSCCIHWRLLEKDAWQSVRLELVGHLSIKQPEQS